MNKNSKPPGHRHASVLRQLVELIPSHLVPKLARAHGVDARARTFSPWSHIVTLLYPKLTVRALAAELERQGVLPPGRASESTLRRRLAEVGLDRQSLRAGAGLIGGPTKAFELPLPNILWMADCMHGPTLQTEAGAQRTYLFALIDDCTRLLIHGQFYGHERLEGFLDVLRQAVQTRGVPDKCYTDNGSAFRSQHLGIVCANLGIRLLHCKPYHAWTKGKLEK